MATTRAQGIHRKEVVFTGVGTNITMVTADMRDLNLLVAASITWEMSYSSLDAINAGSATWVAVPAAVSGVHLMSNYTPQAIRASAAAAASAVATWKA